MNRRALGALAIVVIILMGIVATAGLDGLPRDVRRAIETAATRIGNERAQVEQSREFVSQALRTEPVLFRTKADLYRQRLDAGAGCLSNAQSEIASLQQLLEQNRRADADQARASLSKLDSMHCSDAPVAIRAEAERWINYKRELPDRVQSMQASYDALSAFDVAAATAVASKAMWDWPDKRADLENRTNQLTVLKEQGEQAWQSSAELRAAAGSNELDNFDYAAFFQSADRIDQVSRELKESATAVNALAGQLYTAWDKLLLEVDEDHTPPAKVRVVRTAFKDPSLKGGETTSEEQWENMAVLGAKKPEDTVGMVFERKAAGKYDSEAERIVQPPAYARVAPPGQANAYGSWQNGVWHWLPQYLILSQLLNTSRGPISTGDYYAYDQARRRGQVFYGRNNEFRWGHRPRSTGGGLLGRAKDWAKSSGSGTDFYKERSRKTWGGSGGFSGSKYRSRGTFSGSRFQSRGSFGSRSFSRGFGGGRGFGRR
jgi:hypothetical protein